MLAFHLFVVAVFVVPYLESFDFGCGSESEIENLHESSGSFPFSFVGGGVSGFVVGGGDGKAYFVSLCNIVLCAIVGSLRRYCWWTVVILWCRACE